MTLPTGTALHYGDYVVDAFSAEDDIGPIYLATHISTGRWVQLRILGSRHPESIPLPDERTAFYHYLLKIQALNHSLFSAHLSGFEDQGVCYQTIDANLGYPLSRLVSPEAPISPSQSIALIRQISQGLLALKPLGWQGIVLTPDQFWQKSPTSFPVFTGFDLPHSDSLPANYQEARIVKGLSHLLYFLLTGKSATATQAPLAVDVRNRLPHLPYELDTALQLGSQQNPGRPALDLHQWIDLLPHEKALVGKTSHSSNQKPNSPSPPAFIQSTIAPPEPLSTDSPLLAKPGRGTAGRVPSPADFCPSPSSRKWAPAALAFTAVIASFSGLGIGLTARLQPSHSHTPVRMNPEQPFPPLSDWNGDVPMEDWQVSPAHLNLPDYGEAPPTPALAVPDGPPDSVSPKTTAVEETTELDNGTDTPLEGDIDLDHGSTEGDFFFETQEPFTSPPKSDGVPPTLSDDVERVPPTSADPMVEPPAPMRPALEPTTPLPKPPQPLTVPAPLSEPPPSAPSPSTYQQEDLPRASTESLLDSSRENAETSGSRTL